jgi:hypothetical protein
LNFYLFGKVKTAFIAWEIPNEIDFPEAVTDILSGVSDAELQCIFQSWAERVKRVIDARGDYLSE